MCFGSYPSDAISKNPAQSRLEKLQKQIKLERAAREASKLSTNSSLTSLKIPKKTSKQDNKTVPIESPSKLSLPIESKTQREPPASLSTSKTSNLKRGSLSDTPPAKKSKLEPTVSDKNPSLFSGLFSFAKNVVRTVAITLGSSSENQSNNTTNVEPNDTRFEFEPRNETTENAVFRFTAGSKSQDDVPNVISSPTPANDRLARLRQDLIKTQKKDPIIVSESANYDDVIMTDDEEDTTTQSNLTNDSDDGNFCISFIKMILYLNICFCYCIQTVWIGTCALN